MKKYIPISLFFLTVIYFSYYGRITYIVGLFVLFIFLCIAAVLFIAGVIQWFIKRKANLILYSMITLALMVVSSTAGYQADKRKTIQLKNKAKEIEKVLDSYALKNKNYPQDITILEEEIKKVGLDLTGIKYKFINKTDFVLQISSYCGYYYTKSEQRWALRGCR